MIKLVEAEDTGIFVFPLDVERNMADIDTVRLNGQRINNYTILGESNELEVPLARKGDQVTVEF